MKQRVQAHKRNKYIYVCGCGGVCVCVQIVNSKRYIKRNPRRDNQGRDTKIGIECLSKLYLIKYAEVDLKICKSTTDMPNNIWQ